MSKSGDWRALKLAAAQLSKKPWNFLPSPQIFVFQFVRPHSLMAADRRSLICEHLALKQSEFFFVPNCPVTVLQKENRVRKKFGARKFSLLN